VGSTSTTTYDPRNIACEVGTYDNRIFQKMSFPGKQTVPSLRNNSEWYVISTPIMLISNFNGER
jgi:hypothetical protein